MHSPDGRRVSVNIDTGSETTFGVHNFITTSSKQCVHVHNKSLFGFGDSVPARHHARSVLVVSVRWSSGGRNVRYVEQWNRVGDGVFVGDTDCSQTQSEGIFAFGLIDLLCGKYVRISTAIVRGNDSANILRNVCRGHHGRFSRLSLCSCWVSNQLDIYEVGEMDELTWHGRTSTCCDTCLKSVFVMLCKRTSNKLVVVAVYIEDQYCR